MAEGVETMVAERAGSVSRAAMLRVFGNGNFRLLWLAQLVSQAGDRAHQIALPIYVGMVTGSALHVGLLFATVSLCHILLGPLAGTLVDRWERRRVMIYSDLIRAGLVLLVPTLLWIDIRLAYPVTFLMTTALLFFGPARLSILPDLVSEDELVEANSVFSITETSVDLVGFTLAGIVVSLLGAIPVFYFDALTYLVSAALISLIAFRERSRPRRMTGFSELVEDLRAGARFLWGNAVLRANTILFFVAPLAVGVVAALTPMYSLQVLGTGAWGYGILEASMGLGALVGGLLVGRYLSRRPKGPVILLGFTVMGLCTAALGLTHGLLAAALWFAGSGLGNMFFYINSVALVQKLTPIELRGRVFSLRMVLIQAGIMASAALGGALAGSWGIQGVFLVAGLLLVAISALAARWPEVRGAE